jgi:hypothetical protein
MHYNTESKTRLKLSSDGLMLLVLVIVFIHLFTDVS